MGLKILFLVLTISLMTRPAFSDITINQTLFIGDVLEIRFITPSGGIPDFNNSFLTLGISLVPPVVSTDYLSAKLFVGNSLLGSNSGYVYTSPPSYGEVFIWGNQNTSNPGSHATLVDFTSILNGTSQGLIQVQLASSNPVTMDTIGLNYGSSVDGGIIIIPTEGLTYSVSITSVPREVCAIEEVVLIIGRDPGGEN